MSEERQQPKVCLENKENHAANDKLNMVCLTYLGTFIISHEIAFSCRPMYNPTNFISADKKKIIIIIIHNARHNLAL